MRQSRGFTLRDLVAILCLVVLAVPVVAGSMRGVIGRAHLARCRANLRGLMHGVHLYAQHNGGYMPVYTHLFTSGYVRAPDNTYKSYVAFRSSPVDPNTGLFKDVRNLALLYVQQYVRRPELFYCPAQPDERMRLEHYPKPWGSAVGVGSQYIRIAYMWDPWVKQIPGGAENQWTFEDGLSLRMHPFHRPLICDLVDDYASVAHVMGNSAIWNMAYPAGHVRGFASKKLYGKFFPPGGGPGMDTSQDWLLFNTHVRPLLPGADAKWWDWTRRWRHRPR